MKKNDNIIQRVQTINFFSTLTLFLECMVQKLMVEMYVEIWIVGGIMEFGLD